MMPPSAAALFKASQNGSAELRIGVAPAIRTLLGLYRRFARLMSLDLAARTARSLIQLVIPLVVLRVFQVYLPAGDLRGTLWAAVLFFGLAVGAAALEWVATICGQWLGFRIEAALRENLFRHIESLPFAYFDRTKTGEVLSRMTGDLRQVGMTAHLLPASALEIALMLVGSFAVMFSLNPALAAWTLLPVPFILVFAGAFQKRIHAVWRGNRRDAAAFAAHVENAVQGIREIKSFTCEAREMDAFRRVNDRFRLSFEAMSRLYAPLNSITQLMIECYSLLYIALGAYCAVRGTVSVAEVFAFYMYSRYVTTPMMRVVNFLDMFQQGIVGCRRYLEVMAEPKEEEAAGADVDEMDGKVAIVFRNVRFRYPGAARDVIDVPALSIPAGSVCAFVGPSGGGKSTIAALIPRFYDPVAGEILIDGRDTARVSKRALRAAIGMVAQRPFLFDGTIRENLLLGDATADDARLIKALNDANLADFVQELPLGLDTEVGEHGVRLSGGQAQRIAIARVFLKNPSILILDEATSALDTFAEAAVQEALGRLAKGRTTIIIAHRLTTIRHATLICYLERGKIVESGSHDELLARDGRYRALQAVVAGR